MLASCEYVLDQLLLRPRWVRSSFSWMRKESSLDTTGADRFGSAAEAFRRVLIP